MCIIIIIIIIIGFDIFITIAYNNFSCLNFKV